MMALGTLCGASAYYQWESAILARRLELTSCSQEVPQHEMNLLRMAQRRANMESGLEMMHQNNSDRYLLSGRTLTMEGGV